MNMRIILDQSAKEISEQQVISNQQQENIPQFKVFWKDLEKQVRENLEKSNNFLEIRKILLKHLEKPFYNSTNFLQTFFILAYHQEDEELYKKQEKSGEKEVIFLSAQDLISIIQKRFEFLENFPPVSQKEEKYKEELVEILNIFRKTFKCSN